MTNRMDLSRATPEEVKAEIDRLEDALDKGMLWPKSVTIHLHGSKDSNWETASDLGFYDVKAENAFAYTCYEVSVTLEVNMDGSAYATHFNGVELKEKTKV